MADRQLMVLFPCHGWGDFPIQLEGPEADGLLAAWSALWHPELLVAAGSMPRWYRADAPPDVPPGSVIVIPPVSERSVPAEWTQRAVSRGSTVLCGMHDRHQLLAATADSWQVACESTDVDLAADFLAFGSGYLAVNLLAREMYTAHYLDEGQLQDLLLAAAAEAVAGDSQSARQTLARLYERLLENRDHYSPIDAYLIDLTLVAATTLGESLREELLHARRKSTPVNLVLSGEMVDRMASTEPETLDAVREALEHGDAELVGGEYADRTLGLRAPEELLAALELGRSAYEKHLGQTATVFGRRTFGLSPLVPQILSGCGFRGALHTALDGEPIPVSRQVKIRWEGFNGRAIDALAATVLDATRPESFLRLARMMGQSMHRDYVATVCYAHWPGQRSIWYEDLRRIASYSPILGRFMRLSDYFSSGVPPDGLTRFDPDRYGTPRLSHAVANGETDPVSTAARAERQTWQQYAAETALALASIAEGRVTSGAREGLEDGTLSLLRAIGSQQKDDAEGRLVVNPFSFPWSLPVECASPRAGVPRTGTEQPSPRALDKRRELVQVPAMGYAWRTATTDATPPRTWRKSHRRGALAENHLLRNEFFEVRVHPRTGGIEAIHSRDVRGNRLAQQVALRMDEPVTAAHETPFNRYESIDYSTMVADTVEVTAADAVLGAITSRGRLVDQRGETLATFRQVLQVVRQSRVVDLELQLDPIKLPLGDPWRSYYAARFAWPDESARMGRGVGLTRQPTQAMRFEAPHFVEVGGDQRHVTLLTGGLCYHQRSGPRMLDTLLIVAGETARTFRLGIGVDLAHPLPAALEQLMPRASLAIPATSPRGSTTGWLLHVDARNVVITHCAPLLVGPAPVDHVPEGRPPGSTPQPGPRVVGFRIRLLETEGLSGRVRLSSFRGIASARRTDLLGEPLAELPVSEGRVAMHVGKYEWLQIEARWSETES